MINIYYPADLIYVAHASKYNFIPKKVSSKQKYFKLYHKYYYSEFSAVSYFKVIDQFNIDGVQYVTLSFSGDLYWTIPNYIECPEETYELVFDNKNLLRQKIINSEESYAGYEIIYWFYERYHKRFSEFIPYVEDNGNCRLNDSLRYYLYADYINGKFTNIKIISDRRNQHEVE